jgi:hypothetical protein
MIADLIVFTNRVEIAASNSLLMCFRSQGKPVNGQFRLQFREFPRLAGFVFAIRCFGDISGGYEDAESHGWTWTERKPISADLQSLVSILESLEARGEILDGKHCDTPTH